MLEWLAEKYLRLAVNSKVLLSNPSGCYAVGYLRLFTLTLLVVVALKLAVHLIVFYRLKRRFSEYAEGEEPRLLRLYRQAAREVGLRRTPRLYRFANERPLAFSIGIWRPAIFLAPRLVEELPEPELKAALVHELTHIRRCDNLRLWLLEIFFASIPMLIVQLFAIQFIFSAPNSRYAFWGAIAGLIVFRALLWKRILSMREQSCDDLTVDVTRDPLTLASSLIKVWHLGLALPKHRWRIGPTSAQSLLPSRSDLEVRVRRLLNYRRPWLKFFLGRVARGAAIVSLMFLAVFLAYFHAERPLLLAQNQPSAAGRWQGAVSLQDSMLCITVDLARSKLGKWTGEVHIPCQGIKNFPLINIRVEGSAVSFDMPGAAASPSFRGKLSEDGRSISGGFSARPGRTFPLELERQYLPVSKQ